MSSRTVMQTKCYVWESALSLSLGAITTLELSSLFGGGIPMEAYVKRIG